MRYELTQFSPAEAEQVTGVPPALQRVWRQRGFLPSAGGRVSSFDVHSLARLLFLRLMSDRGIGPADLADTVILEASARRIAYDALTNGAAYGAHYPRGDSLEEFILARMSPEEVKNAAGDADPLKWLRGAFRVARQNEELACRIAYEGVPKVICGPLFIWFADGEPYWDGVEGGKLNEELGRAGAEGAIVLMVLPQIGRMLVQRASRALVTIHES